MTKLEMELEMIDHACCGNAEAADFVRRVNVYFHAADDLIDEDCNAEFKIKVLVMAQDLYSHPFFLKYAHPLNAVIRTCISTYADSVAWEGSDDPERRTWADHARHCGLDVTLVVADILGGWEYRRAVAKEWREYHQQLALAEKLQAKG